ncbi:MAG: hypothetical protein P8P36_11300 [Akkermansiaceae bacterium]|nr:hypothetical protein [Akkermansiaceae bacterium]
MKRIFFVLGLSVVTALCEEGEVSGSDSDDERLETQIMVIALGSVPPRKYGRSGTQGDAAMLLPKEGEVPPNKLYYKSSAGGSLPSSKWQPLNVTFNNMSSMHFVPAGRDLVLYRKLARHYEPYVVIPSGEVGMKRAVLLTQDFSERNRGEAWHRNPNLTIIDRESASLRDKQFAIKNLSKMNVLHAFDGEVASVRRGQLIGYKRNKNGVLYHLAASYGARRKIIYNLAVNIRRDNALHLYVLYDADPGTNAGRSVAVFRIML